MKKEIEKSIAKFKKEIELHEETIKNFKSISSDKKQFGIIDLYISMYESEIRSINRNIEVLNILNNL
jgi:hypothetical protein